MSLGPEEARSAPWWPELLAIKDTLSYAALSERFGLPAHTLRRALELAGETKVSMPRGPKPRVATGSSEPREQPVEDASANPLDRVRGKVGRMPDAEVAQLAGVSVDEVKVYRREHGISPFLRAPPTFAGAATVAPPRELRVAVGDVDPVVLRRRISADGPVAETVLRPPVQAAAVEPAPAHPTVRSPLEAFHDRLGKVADQVIADESGVARTAVGDYRRKLGIAAYDGFRYRTGEARQASIPAEPATAAAASRSAIEPYMDMLGTCPDSEIAAMAGVSSAAVAKFRTRRGIAGFVPAAAPLEREVAPPEERDATSTEAASHRVSKLDAHRDLIGVLTDAEVALRAGMSSEGVRMYRKRHGIPARSSAAAVPPPTAPAPQVPAPPPLEPPAPAASVPPLAPAVGAPWAAPIAASPVVVPEAEPVMLAAEPPVEVPAPAPPAVSKPSALAAAVVSEPPRAFAVVALRGDEVHRFVSVGVDMPDALTNAIAALAARSDGPWRMRSIRDFVEALVAPGRDCPAQPEQQPPESAPGARVLAPAVASRVPAALPEPPHEPANARPVAPDAAPARAPAPADPPTLTGADLRTYRQKHGLTQTELAARLGSQQSAVSRAEVAAATPLLPVLLRAFRHLRGDEVEG